MTPVDAVNPSQENIWCGVIPSRILIYRLGSMGDTLVALPCLHAIRKWFPKSHITLLTNLPVNVKARAGADLLVGTGLVNEYIDYPVGVRDPRVLVSLMGRLRRGRYDLVVDLAQARGFFKSLRDWLFFCASGYPRVVGIPWGRSDLTCPPDPGRPGYYKPEASRLTQRLRSLGSVDLGDRSLWSLNLRADELSRARETVESAGIKGAYIAISAGTKDDAKDWTEINWVRMLSELSAQRPALGLILLGAPDERERSARMQQAWSPGISLNLTGQLSVRESAAMIAGSALFVGHDSGPMHLAASVNVRCIAIFAARNLPGQWFPAGEGHRVFYNKTECFGCGLASCVKHAKKCILGIPYQEVTKAALEIVST